MQKHVVILATMAVLVSSIGALVLVGVILDRANHTKRWSFTEIVGYPAAAVGVGLVLALIAWLLGRAGTRPPRA